MDRALGGIMKLGKNIHMCLFFYFSWTQKPPTRFVIETFQLITRAVCCGYISNLICRITINIPEIILGMHGLMGFTVMDCQ